MWRLLPVSLAVFAWLTLAPPTASAVPPPTPRHAPSPPRSATVYVNGLPVIRLFTPDGFPTVAQRALVVERRLLRLAARGPLNAAYLAVRPFGDGAVLLYDGRVLATADRATASRSHLPPAVLASVWANRLTRALGAPRPSFAVARRAADFRGLASWYGPGFSGLPTADGEIFDPHLFTAASRSLPFNTLVAVTDLRTRRSVLVRVNDRGPYVAGRILDLSQAAAGALGLSGVDDVSCAIVRSGAPVIAARRG